MFCCNKQQSHVGELVTAICLQSQCSNPQKLTELCCSLCISQIHKTHRTTSLKNYFPTLLRVNYEKQKLFLKLKEMMCQQLPEFFQDFGEIQQTFKHFLHKIRIQFDQNKEDANKIRKALRAVQQTQIAGNQGLGNSNVNSVNKSNFLPGTDKKTQSHLSSPMRPNSNGVFQSHFQSFKPQSLAISQISSPWGFSHKLKHSHVALSTNCKTATKTTSNPMKVAAMSSFYINQEEPQIKLKIQESSGNIMIGFCHQKIVEKKDFLNCYGMSSGTYVLSQNCNDKHSCLSFHHSNNKFNRKQIAGWNFLKSDTLLLGVNFCEGYMFFRNIAQNQQFTMPLQSVDEPLRFIVILQNENDQITIYQ